MKATIVGKRRVMGVGKTDNQPYDYTLVHVNCKQFGIEGLATDVIKVQSRDYPSDLITVGATCEYDRDNRGFLCSFDVCE